MRRPIFRSIELRSATPDADSDQQYRGTVRLVTGLSSLLLIAVIASGCSSAPSSAPAPKSTITAELPSSYGDRRRPTSTTEPPSTATPLYSIEQCGGIATSSDLHPNVDNRTLLLTQADGPPGYTYGAGEDGERPHRHRVGSQLFTCCL